ncbi:hypothetical protein [Bosea sp. 47.2.35]|uniref:hypothetical protein n=1 Tax=Bosea sp. 47.2.35 TaxID=2969304 RepID=UPI00214FC8C5|nr:hypothetical protein [Bosea sp. 47.2.35]MCR4524640.1 hypothetical protein [Bosea sp. 47.2.35]
MTNARTIELARQHLRNGAYGAYARILSGAIRASLSSRTTNAIRAAIAEDEMERLFLNYASGCPSADEQACDTLSQMVELFAKLSPEGQDDMLAKLQTELREQMAERTSPNTCEQRGGR